MITIICTTPRQAGRIEYADRELDYAFEVDVTYRGVLCILQFPKECWRAAYELVVKKAA